jgi:hypothetical protein
LSAANAHNNNRLSDVILSKSQDKIKIDQVLTLSLGFKVTGRIRDIFEPKNWERAYNKHDNLFRLTININLKSGNQTIYSGKFVRKAILFWTRSPRIQYRIWISIIKDDTPFHPLSVEEAKMLLFDINKPIELSGRQLKAGRHKISAQIGVFWGKHDFSDPTEISSKSNIIEVTCV